MNYTDEQIRAMVDADFDSMFHGMVGPTFSFFHSTKFPQGM